MAGKQESTKNPIDQKIVKRAIKGDRDAIDELCRFKVRSILYVCTKMMGNKQDGEDLSQEVIIRMVQDISKLRNAAGFNMWLYQIIKGEYVRLIRKRVQVKEKEYGMGPLTDALPEPNRNLQPEWYLENEETRAALESMVKSLPTENKLCVLMFYFENMSHKEIARALNIRTDKVDHLLRRSRQLMRRSCEDNHSSKELMHNFSALVSVPVLGGFMKQQAAALPQVAADAVVNGALSSGMAVPSAATAGGVATVVKVAAVTAAIAVGATAGYGIVNHRESAAPVSSSTAATVSTTQSVVDVPVIISEQVITTLEDMLGWEDAELLKTMAASSPVSQAEFERFLENTGMQFKRRLQAFDIHMEYSLYILEKQDKLLMVITGMDSDDGSIRGLTYRFTERSEELPIDGELLHRYQAWGGA